MRAAALTIALLLVACDDDPNPSGSMDGRPADAWRALDFAPADVRRPLDAGPLADMRLADAAPVLDAATPDGPLPDAAAPDGPLLDATPPDGPLLDAAPPDGPLLDAAPPDGPLLDAAAPDGPLLDAAAPDGPLLDAATPDGPLLDGPLADAATPDGPLPDAGPPPNPLPIRPIEQTCVLPEAPPVGAYALEPRWPDLHFSRALWVGPLPGSPGVMVVVEQGGSIYTFDDRPDVTDDDRQLFLEVPLVYRGRSEEGLLGLAFHPDFPENGRLFTYHSMSNPNCAPGQARCSRLSEFRRDPDNPRRALPDSQQVLLDLFQPFWNHNGGDLKFGPDRRLYVSLGDGGSAGDPMNNGQDPHTLYGSVLRLDVDQIPEGAAYGIPPDNPFADGLDGRPEVWAWGLRNPWRMGFDPSNGDLWVGDVGQSEFEEIDILVPGNFGWRGREGFECYEDPQCDGDYIEPVYAYGRNLGGSIIGGYVYRGDAFPDLWGAYLFADFLSGRVWALRDGEAVQLARHVGQSLTSFGVDWEGGVLLTAFGDEGRVQHLVAADAPGPPTPERLSETGCFTDTASHTTAPGLVPYDVNAPLWSDGVAKQRYLALPAGAQARWSGEDGPLSLPVGTVLVKTFTAPGGRRIETRMLTRQAGGWRGFTWRWNDEQTDALLVAGGLNEEVAGLQWRYPSAIECDLCHTAAAGFVLGPRPQQLAGRFELDGVEYDQLAALVERGYLDRAGPVTPLARPGDEGAPLGDRARAWLDANCSSCHRPDGPAYASIDLRARTPLSETEACDVAPSQGDLGLEDARIIAPGDPDRSVLAARIASLGPRRMPPLGTARVDEQGLALVRAWISAAACD